MNDKELDNYIKIINPDFNSHIEKGTIEMNNEYYNLLEEKMARLINQNQELKSQLKGTTHCFDEEEHKRLSEQLELLTSKLDEYDLIVDERNQLKEQLEDEEQWRIKIAKENDEAFRGRMILIEEKEKLKKQLENTEEELELVRCDLHNRTSERDGRKRELDECLSQQKEFINYLEDEIHTIETTYSQINGNYGLMNEKLEALKEVLQKYKEIIGVEDENKTTI